MKRGLITWDQAELPPAAFEARHARVRHLLQEHDLPALAVYSDVLRSNAARFLTNYMPYWNRALAVIPREGAPVLLCGLSPRVYPWIKSVTVFDDVRPAGNPVAALTRLCEERSWTKLGVLNLPGVPAEITAPLRTGPLQLTNLRLDLLDEYDVAMRRRAAELTRRVLEGSLSRGSGRSGQDFAGQLEGALRLAGAEDVTILLGDGESSPTAPRADLLRDPYTVAVALEYRGHWVKVTRTQTNEKSRADLRHAFDRALRTGQGLIENLVGSYPFEPGPGNIFALHVAVRVPAGSGDEVLRYGDTCVHTPALPQLL